MDFVSVLLAAPTPVVELSISNSNIPSVPVAAAAVLTAALGVVDIVLMPDLGSDKLGLNSGGTEKPLALVLAEILSVNSFGNNSTISSLPLLERNSFNPPISFECDHGPTEVAAITVLFPAMMVLLLLVVVVLIGILGMLMVFI